MFDCEKITGQLLEFGTPHSLREWIKAIEQEKIGQLEGENCLKKTASGLDVENVLVRFVK